MADFAIKKGDTLPAIQSNLVDAAGVAISLAAATVRFRMRRSGESTNKVDASASILSASAGLVAYAWAPEDTDVPGVYEAEWIVTYGAEEIFTAPNNAFLTVQVFDNLAES